MKNIIYILKEELRLAGIYPQGRKNRMDLITIPVQDGVELIIYWKVEKIGKGPAIALRAYGREVVRFDCFGKNKGHYHIFPHSALRIPMFEETVDDQIYRSIRELEDCTSSFLSQHHISKVRRLAIDYDSLATALSSAKETMLNYKLKVK